MCVFHNFFEHIFVSTLPNMIVNMQILIPQIILKVKPLGNHLGKDEREIRLYFLGPRIIKISDKRVRLNCRSYFVRMVGIDGNFFERNTSSEAEIFRAFCDDGLGHGDMY